MRYIRSALVLGVFLCLTAPAHAQSSDNTWSAEVFAGWDNGISGNILGAGVGTLVGQPAVIDSQSYDDVYGTGVRWRFTGAYRLNPRSEVLGSLELSTASGDVRQVGNISGDPLFVSFDDYRTVGLEAGYRYYFADQGREGRIKPYVGGLLGVDLVKSIDAAITVPSQGLVVDTVHVYDGTGAFLFGVNGGAFFDLTDRVAVGGELGLRHRSGLNALQGLSGTGLDSVTDDTGRWSLPLTFGVRVKF